MPWKVGHEENCALFVSALVVACCCVVCAGCGGKGKDAKLTSLSVSPSDATIDAVGLTRQFTATGFYSDGATKDLTGEAIWSSQDEAIAAINANGLATAKGAGQTAITATSEGLSSSATLTVHNKPFVTAIDVTPKNACLYPSYGSTRQYKATASYSDGQTNDVTNQSAWSSSDTSVVTIDSSGLARGKGYGKAAITALFSSVSGTASVVVVSDCGGY